MLTIAIVRAVAVSASPSTTYYVSPRGDDFARGTSAAPFRTIERAQLAARSSGVERSTVQLTPGTHWLDRPVYLDEADSGLWLRGSSGGTTTVSAGSMVTGWANDGAGTWSAPAPAGLAGNIRQLYVNGSRAARTSVLWKGATPAGWTRSTNGFHVTGDQSPLGWLNPDSVEFLWKGRGYFTLQRCTVAKVSTLAAALTSQHVAPSPSRPSPPCSVSLTRQISRTSCQGHFGCFANNRSMWAADGCSGIFQCDGHANVACAGGFGKTTACPCVSAPPPPPPPPGTLSIEFKQPCFNNTAMQGAHLGGTRVWAIENLHSGFASASSGTFYHDRSGQAGGKGCAPGQSCLLYKPRPGEDMRSVEVVAPRLEALLVAGQLAGAMSEGPGRGGAARLANITVSGIRFEHVAWHQPSGLDGYASQQASIFSWGNSTRNGFLIPCEGLDCATVPAAVRMLGVRDFHLLNCSFAHLGGAGVSFAGGTQHSSVSGCEFYDISASGVTVGTAMSSYLALDPAAQDGGITIADNRIHSVAVEYSGAVGILSTFTAGLRHRP